MKKFIIILFFLGTVLSSTIAQTVQGGITLTGTTLTVVAKPSADIAAQVGNINVVISIPDQSALGGNPTDADITSTVLLTNAKIDNGTGVIVNPTVVNGRAYYTYLIFQNNGTDANTSWAANVTNPVISFTFPGSAATYLSDARVNDLTSASGGASGQMYWYVQFNGLGDVTNYATPFYSASAVNNGGTAEQFAPIDQTTPVKFTTFSATKKDNNALLAWQITNEDANVASYDVERSTNGVSFTKVSSIAPKNNGFSSNTYDLTDNISMLQSAGIIYYRIKQVDKDGRTTYTDIKSVRITSTGIAVNVYPNPVKDMATLTLDLTKDEAVTVNITDATGKDVKHLNINAVKGFNTQRISMSTLATGNYILKVKAGNEIKILPIVKAK